MNCCNSTGRISALLLRYLYLLRSSWPRIINCILANYADGHIDLYLSIFRVQSRTYSGWYSYFSSFSLGLSLPSHISYTLSFLEELWSRNLGNLFVSPLRPSELIAALASISMMKP